MGALGVWGFGLRITWRVLSRVPLWLLYGYYYRAAISGGLGFTGPCLQGLRVQGTWRIMGMVTGLIKGFYKGSVSFGV